MGDERRCHTRIFTKPGPVYAVLEEWEHCCDRTIAAHDDSFIVVTSWSGEELMAPERTSIRFSEIMAFQEISEASWAWQKMANQRHYAEQLEDSPSQVSAKATARMAEILEQGLE